MRAVLTGTGRDVQPERLFGRLPLRRQEPLGQAPQIGSGIARAKAALHREDLYPDGSISCVIVNLDTVGDLLGHRLVLTRGDSGRFASIGTGASCSASTTARRRMSTWSITTNEASHEEPLPSRRHPEAPGPAGGWADGDRGGEAAPGHPSGAQQPRQPQERRVAGNGDPPLARLRQHAGGVARDADGLRPRAAAPKGLFARDRPGFGRPPVEG
jgi:hypothetical protein